MKMMMCRLGVEGEQPDNKNTRNSTLYFTSNRVVALFTGSLSLRGRLSCLHIVDVLATRAA